MPANSNTKTATIFSSGLALSAATASIVAAYTFTRNASLEVLLYLFLSFVFIVLLASAITYFAYGRLGSILERLDMSVAPMAVFILQTIDLLLASELILRALIYYQVPYGYIVLPVAIDIAGAIILVGVVRVLRIGKLAPRLRVVLLVAATFLLGILAIM